MRLRLSEFIYPDGREVYYNYAAGVDSAVSWVSEISDDTMANSGRTQFAQYDYLGAGTIAAITQGNGVTNDLFAGWDRFGRTANMLGDRKRISMVSPDYGISKCEME
jgi:hypothetical protein